MSHLVTFSRMIILTLIAASSTGCADLNSLEDFDEAVSKSGTLSHRQKVLLTLRDRAASRGIQQIIPLAGIANAETGLAHCWSDAQWACQGPVSSSCEGGPVIAGSGDGPCWREQGGLGLFQLDGGTFDQTLSREGRGILTLDGNIDAGINFVINMIRSAKGLSTDQAAIDWLNGVQVGSTRYNDWIDIVVEKYNGCRYAYCSIFLDRWYHYDGKTRAVVADVERLPSPPSDHLWIGSPCQDDSECNFHANGSLGWCLKGSDEGVCVSSCEGYCPDRTSSAPTFCASADQLGLGAGGLCLAQSSSLNSHCQTNHLYSKTLDRFVGGSSASPKRLDVCIPTELSTHDDTIADDSDSLSAAEDNEGVCDDASLPLHDQSCQSSEEGSWRCACHGLYAMVVSQVCRSGAWVNYHLEPSNCAQCNEFRSIGCN